MEELCTVEFFKDGDAYVARIKSASLGRRQYTDASFEEVLGQVTDDLHDEFDLVS